MFKFVLGNDDSGQTISVPLATAIASSNEIKVFVDNFGDQQAMPIHSEYAEVLHSYAHYLNHRDQQDGDLAGQQDEKKQEYEVDSLATSLSLAHFLSDDGYFDFLIQYLFRHWSSLYQGLRQIPLATDLLERLILQLPYIYLPEDYCSDSDKLAKWTAVNLHRTVAVLDSTTRFQIDSHDASWHCEYDSKLEAGEIFVIYYLSDDVDNCCWMRVNFIYHAELQYVRNLTRNWQRQGYWKTSNDHRGYYFDNKKLGLWQTIKDGKVVRNEQYCNGKLDGLVEVYADAVDNGNVNSNITTSITNQQFPLSTVNRRLVSQTNYCQDLTDGEERQYHTNGQLSCSRNYHEGKLQGLSMKYYASGKLQLCEVFIDDQLHGTSTHYEEDDQAWQQTEWLYGQRHGDCVSYYNRTLIRCRESYHNDVLLSRRLYDVLGCLITKEVYRQGRLVLQFHYDSHGSCVSRLRYDAYGNVSNQRGSCYLL